MSSVLPHGSGREPSDDRSAARRRRTLRLAAAVVVGLIVTTLYLLGTWPATSGPRIVAMLLPWVVFLVLLVVWRKSKLQEAFNLLVAVALTVLAYWFIPTSEGVSYWQATREVERLRAVPPDNWNGFRQEQANCLALASQFEPSLRDRLAAATRDWAAHAAPPRLAGARDLHAGDPARAAALLQELRRDLEALDRGPREHTGSSIVHDHEPAIQEAARLILKGQMNRALGELADLRAQKKFEDIEKLGHRLEADWGDLARAYRESPDGPTLSSVRSKYYRVALEPEFAQLRALCDQGDLSAALTRLRWIAEGHPQAIRHDGPALMDEAHRSITAAAGRDLAALQEEDKRPELLRLAMVLQGARAAAQESSPPISREYDHLIDRACNGIAAVLERELDALEKEGKNEELLRLARELRTDAYARVRWTHQLVQVANRCTEAAFRFESRNFEPLLQKGDFAGTIAHLDQIEKTFGSWHYWGTGLPVIRFSSFWVETQKKVLQAAAQELESPKSVQRIEEIERLARELEGRWRWKGKHFFDERGVPVYMVPIAHEWGELRDRCGLAALNLELGQLEALVAGGDLAAATAKYQEISSKRADELRRPGEAQNRLTMARRRWAQARLADASRELEKLQAAADLAGIDRLTSRLKQEELLQVPDAEVQGPLGRVLGRCAIAVVGPELEKAEALAKKEDFGAAIAGLRQVQKERAEVLRFPEARARLNDAQRRLAQTRLEAARKEFVVRVDQEDYAGVERLKTELGADWLEQARQAGVEQEMEVFVQQCGVVVRIARAAGKVGPR